MSDQSLREFDEITAILRQAGLPDEARALKEELRPIVEEYNSSEFRVTVLGKQNSGKSTLLNVLCDHFNDEIFPTGDRIVTKKKQIEKHHGTVFVDTPGLDASDEDDEEAGKALKTGAVLFLHSCLTRELDRQECESLKRLVQEFDQPERQIVVLCSKMGEEINDIDAVVDMVRTQARQIVGDEVAFIPIDSIEYKIGNTDKKEHLIKHSHVTEVSAWIEDARKVPNRLETKFTKRWEEILGKVERQKNAVKKDLEKCHKKRKELLADLRGRWEELQCQW
jgi:GTPase SAR1 family protein